MFIETVYETNGKLISRFINLNQVVSLGEAEGARKEDGYQTVLFMPNGYAMFSRMTPLEIIALTK